MSKNYSQDIDILQKGIKKHIPTYQEWHSKPNKEHKLNTSELAKFFENLTEGTFIQFQEFYVKHKESVKLQMNYLGIYNSSILHNAIYSDLDAKEKVKFLLEEGVYINLRDENDQTALQYAVLMEQYDIVELLLKEGAQANTFNKYGENPLMTAISITNENVKKENFIKLLLEYDADPYFKEDKTDNALEFATNLQNIDLINLLLTYKDEIRNDEPQSTKEINVINSIEEKVENFDYNPATVKHRHVPSILDNFQKPPYNFENLSYDLEFKFLESLRQDKFDDFSATYELFKQYVSNNYWINFFRGHKSLLHFAIYTTVDVEDKLTLLYKKGLNVDARNSDDKTVLHLAIMEKKFEAAKILLDLGAEPNTFNMDGTTPLIEALDLMWFYKKYSTTYSTKSDEYLLIESLIKLLLKHNADIDLKKDGELSAREFAQKYLNIEITEFLKTPNDEIEIDALQSTKVENVINRIEEKEEKVDHKQEALTPITKLSLENFKIAINNPASFKENGQPKAEELKLHIKDYSDIERQDLINFMYSSEYKGGDIELQGLVVEYAFS